MFSGPSIAGWALLLLVVVTAAGLRLWHLGEWPPGPYRDEAFNGLDALGVLRGEHALFFPANNGREPLYIYLASLAIALLGPTTLALRLPAAIVGTLATIPTYLLGREWYGRTTGLLAAILWAVTFWPVHLGRIGLRAGLLAPLLALAFWLGTRAYREQRNLLWLLAGVAYGLTFYTYLAARLTPLLLGLFGLYLVVTGRRERLWDSGRVLWFIFGSAVVVAPLAVVLAGNPEFLLGRAGQVSVVSQAGDGPAVALLENAARALGMYLWRGDTILRHNALLTYDVALQSDHPIGRPVFDMLMAGPFLAGLVWCLQHWRRPAAALLLLWQLVMLAPTILAEDAPHFLRAAGVLPGAVFFPAIGLGLLWEWSRLPAWSRRAAVGLLLAGSLLLTVRDYARYARQPDVAYLFESAAAELADSAAADIEAGATVYIDRRFIDGWPSIRYLLASKPITPFDSSGGPGAAAGDPAVIYAWPYDSLDYLMPAVSPPASVEIAPGPLARGDLEPQPYSLFTRYSVSGRDNTGILGNFGGEFFLRDADAVPAEAGEMAVTLQWEAQSGRSREDGELPSVFIHVTGPEGMIGQYDGPIALGLWPARGWQPGIAVSERHSLQLARPFNPVGDRIEIGLYWGDTAARLPLLNAQGVQVDDKIVLGPEP